MENPSWGRYKIRQLYPRGRYWMMVAGYWMQDSDCWMLDTDYGIKDAHDFRSYLVARINHQIQINAIVASKISQWVFSALHL